MTTPDEPTTGPVADALRDRREKITSTRKIRTRPAPARKGGTRPGPARPTPAKTTAPKVTPGQAIAEGVGMLGSLIHNRAPVHAAVIKRQSVELGPIIDALAEEDKRVAAIVEKISGWLTAGGAWTQAATWALSTGGALAIASGVENPLLTMLAGSIVQASTLDAAVRIAQAEAQAAGIVDEAGAPIVDPDRVAFILAALSAPRRPPGDDGGDPAPDPAA